MGMTYFEEGVVKFLNDHDLCLHFKNLEETLNIAEASSIESYQTKEQIRYLYEKYISEIDERIDSGKITLDEWEDLEEQVEIEIEKGKITNNGIIKF